VINTVTSVCENIPAFLLTTIENTQKRRETRASSYPSLSSRERVPAHAADSRRAGRDDAQTATGEK